MMKTTVTESAIREMVNEVFDDKNYGIPYIPEETPANVSDIVDPSEAIVDPGNEKFNPQNNRELTIAISQIAKTIPEEVIEPFYKRVKQVADDVLSGRENLDAERPKHKTNTKYAGSDTMKNEHKKVEETIRRAVRKILKEMNQAQGEEETSDAAPIAAATAPEPKQRKKWGEKASSHYEKQELTPFSKMAAELGMSVAGAKQAVDKAWRKGAFIHSMFPSEEEKQTYVLDLIHQYIDHLDSSDELSDEDFELLRDHPDMVSELEGFQSFMLDDLKDAGYYPDMEFTNKGKPIYRDR